MTWYTSLPLAQHGWAKEICEYMAEIEAEDERRNGRICIRQYMDICDAMGWRRDLI